MGAALGAQDRWRCQNLTATTTHNRWPWTQIASALFGPVKRLTGLAVNELEMRGHNVALLRGHGNHVRGERGPRIVTAHGEASSLRNSLLPPIALSTGGMKTWGRFQI